MSLIKGINYLLYTENKKLNGPFNLISSKHSINAMFKNNEYVGKYYIHEYNNYEITFDFDSGDVKRRDNTIPVICKSKEIETIQKLVNNQVVFNFNKYTIKTIGSTTSTKFSYLVYEKDIIIGAGVCNVHNKPKHDNDSYIAGLHSVRSNTLKNISILLDIFEKYGSLIIKHRNVMLRNQKKLIKYVSKN